jgi:hypothetical protein
MVVIQTNWRARLRPGQVKFVELLERRPLIDRVMPVLTIAADMMSREPRTTGLSRTLPEYCGRIAQIMRRTHFAVIAGFGEAVKFDPKALAACRTVDEEKSVIVVDWRAFGRWLGVIETMVHLVEGGGFERLWKETFGEQGEEATRLFLKLIFGLKESEIDGLMAEAPNEKPGEFEAKYAVAIETYHRWKRALERGTALPRQWGIEAVVATHRGIAEGSVGIINERLELSQGSNREGVYFFLAAVWPEIQAMQNSNPPLSRMDLHRWLEPFVKDGIVSLGDYGQLCDVCDEIGLKMKGRGRPRKP